MLSSNNKNPKDKHLTHFKHSFALIVAMINYNGMESIDQHIRHLRNRASAVYDEPQYIHEIVKSIEVFEGSGKTKRLSCVQCPSMINGKRNRARDTTTLCCICKVYLHSECFVQYHIENNIDISSNDPDFQSPKPPSTSSASKKRKVSSETSL